MIFLIGGNGLVGSAFVRYFSSNKIKFKNIQRQNYKKFIGKKCDLLIYANGNNNKTFAQKDPIYDFETTVSSTMNYICNIKFKKIIYFSSVDFYSNTKSSKFTNEDFNEPIKNKNNYGFNKFLAEACVSKYCKNYIIFRLGGLVGPNLKKNPIYDLIYKKKIFTSFNSIMNFIHTDFVADIVMKIEKNKKTKNQIFNLCSKNSIKIKNIIKKYKLKDIKVEKKFNIVQKYNINCKKITKLISLPTSTESINKYYFNI